MKFWFAMLTAIPMPNIRLDIPSHNFSVNALGTQVIPVLILLQNLQLYIMVRWCIVSEWVISIPLESTILPSCIISCFTLLQKLRSLFFQIRSVQKLCVAVSHLIPSSVFVLLPPTSCHHKIFPSHTIC